MRGAVTQIFPKARSTNVNVSTATCDHEFEHLFADFLIATGERITCRATLWAPVEADWQIIYYQVTSAQQPSEVNDYFSDPDLVAALDATELEIGGQSCTYNPADFSGLSDNERSE